MEPELGLCPHTNLTLLSLSLSIAPSPSLAHFCLSIPSARHTPPASCECVSQTDRGEKEEAAEIHGADAVRSELADTFQNPARTVLSGSLSGGAAPPTMHTPGPMVMGIVFSPLGLVLVFTAAITPQWREGQARLGVSGPGSLLRAKGQGSAGPRPADSLLLLRSDGLWESCLQVEHSELKQCWPVAGPYQRDPRVRLAQGLVLTSLFLCGTGIVLACIGVRCWTDLPLRGVTATGGLLVVMAGLLSLTALGVYTHNLSRLGTVGAPSQAPPGNHRQQHHQHHRATHLSLHPAGSLYFGWLGSCLQVLGGGALLLSFKQPRCPACPSCPDVPVCPACNSVSEITNRAETDVYEVTC